MPSAKPSFLKTPEGKIAAFLVLYCLVYVVLSAMGDYQEPVLGDPKFAGSKSISVWQPAGVEWRRIQNESGDARIEANFLGWLFLPMIFFDRQLAHPSDFVMFE